MCGCACVHACMCDVRVTVCMRLYIRVYAQATQGEFTLSNLLKSLCFVQLDGDGAKSNHDEVLRLTLDFRLFQLSVPHIRSTHTGNSSRISQS